MRNSGGRRKRRKSKWLYGCMIILLMALVVVGGIFWRAKKIVEASVWDGENQINLVIVNSSARVISFDPEEKTLAEMKIPDDVYVMVPGGYGSYRLGAVYDLGKMERKGGDLLRETVRDFLGIPIDGHIKIKNEKSPPKASHLGGQAAPKASHLGGQAAPKASHLGGSAFGGKNQDDIFNIRNILDAESNLTAWDRLRLWWRIKEVRENRIYEADLEKKGLLSELVLADGTKAKKADLEILDPLVKELFYDRKIKKENFKIEVLNAGKEAGAGQKTARLLTNMGGNVINIANSQFSPPATGQAIPNFPRLGRGRQFPSSDCVLKTTKEKSRSYTVKKIASLFNCSVAEDELGESRADLEVILLGEKQ